MFIKYIGGLASVKAPWLPNPEVVRGEAVEAPDEDASALVGQEASPWVYAGEVSFSSNTIEFTPSSKLEANMPAKEGE